MPRTQDAAAVPGAVAGEPARCAARSRSPAAVANDVGGSSAPYTHAGLRGQSDARGPRRAGERPCARAAERTDQPEPIRVMSSSWTECVELRPRVRHERALLMLLGVESPQASAVGSLPVNNLYGQHT